MKHKATKRILSMLLAVVMIIGFVPTFNLTVLAGEVEADALAGKTVITKVDLTIDMPTKYHDQMRGYDAGDETKVVNLYNSPFYTNNDKPKDVYQNGKLLTYEKLEAGVPAEMYIQLNAKTGDTAYAFDPEHPENVEIWVNGVKRDDAYIYIYPGNQWEYVDVVLPFAVEEYTGSTVNVTFDTEGLAEAAFFRLGAGERNDGAMLPAGGIVAIHGVSQEYFVQHCNATNVTSLHAKDNKAFLLQLFRGNGNLFAVFIAGVEVFTLGEEGILGGFDGFQSLQIHLGILGPKAKVCLASLLNGQNQALLCADGGVKVVEFFYTNPFHAIPPCVTTLGSASSVVKLVSGPLASTSAPA